MKNNLLLVFLGILLLLFLSTIVSAIGCNKNRERYYDENYCYNCHNYNDLDMNDGVIFVIRDENFNSKYVTRDYDNDDRYPTYDYRHGYSYRTSKEYHEVNEKRSYKTSYTYDRRNSDGDYRYSRNEKPSYYYLYNEPMRTYEKKECYVNPPRNKLFYVKCP